jgi:hypothetical protein
MAGNNGSSSLHRPTKPLIGGQYSAPTSQAFAPSPPQQYGQAQPIPKTNQGITAQRSFTKINKQLAPGPIAKIVISLQQSRF